MFDHVMESKERTIANDLRRQGVGLESIPMAHPTD
jgi:hypothetical protein